MMLCMQANKINWKEPEKALTKVYPRELGEDEDEIADPGSFFNFFEHSADPSEVCFVLLTLAGACSNIAQIGVVIANEIFPEAIEYFLGNVNEEDITDSEEEDEDEDDAAEIDLEKPRSKKARV
jgi:template-activating factor I